MRIARVCAAGLILALMSVLCGCGGGDNGGGTVTLNGVWTGTQSRAADGVIEYDYGLSGTAVSGTARITRPDGTIYVGTFTGTYNAPNVDITVTWTDPAGYGTTHFTGALHGSQLSGTYTHTFPDNTVETGTVTLIKESVTTPTNLSGTYNGTETDTTKGQTLNLTLVFTQNGDSLTGTVTISDATQSLSGPISATVIGDHITAGTGSLSGHTFAFQGTVSGNNMSGHWENTSGGGNVGTWNVTGV